MKKTAIKRLKLKTAIWFKKMFSPRDFASLSKSERDSFAIFITLVSDKNSELYIHPVSDKYYIKSQSTGIFITLSNTESEISIINHVYGYNVKIGPRVLKNMNKVFINQIDKRRRELEEEYKNNIQHSLSQIAKTIKERI